MSRFRYLGYASGFAVLLSSLSAYPAARSELGGPALSPFAGRAAPANFTATGNHIRTPAASAAHPPVRYAQTQILSPAASPGSPVNSIAVTNQSGVAIRNYPLQFGRPFLDGAIEDEPQVLIGGTPVTTQADVKNRYPDGSVEYAVVAVMIPSLPAGGSVTLTFQNQTAGNNTPLTQAQMLSIAYMFSAQMILAPTAGGSAQSVDARTMLTGGNYKLWTSGPVAQTVMLADDSPARKYDIGFGDGFHPFRPRYYATFWPATKQVFVRFVGENGNTTELEDLAYSLTLTGANAKLYSNANLAHWAMSSWTKSFWLGGTPSPQVNIDNNLAYLELTRFVPNYDPSVTVTQAAIAYDYAGYYTNVAHDIGEAGGWQTAMGTTGAREDIGPEPTWDAVWLYTGDWRMRQLSLTQADLAAAWPANLREGDPSKRLNRADPVPTSGQTGSGYGLPVSITDRKTLGASAGGEADLLYYAGSQGAPVSDQLNVVGSINFGQPWEFDASHEPSPFFVPYILTGDPFYLLELENWAAYDATENVGQATTSNAGRGPTGDEGGADDQLRGDGWTIRSRAEAAFAAPDGDPEKTYLTILTQEDIARWEGSLGVTDPVLSGSAEYIWAQQTGDPETSTQYGPTSPPPPASLGEWGADVYDTAGVGSYVGAGVWTDATISGVTPPWMQWYTQYAIGRAAELGFAAGPLALQSGRFLTGMINNSGYPELIAAYVLPVGAGTTFLSTWPAIVGEMSAGYLTSTDPNAYPTTSGQAPLPVFFKGMISSQGYAAYASAALATLVDEAAPGAAQAETWMQANVYQPLAISGSLAADPSWAIVPRTDNNPLPAQPTH